MTTIVYVVVVPGATLTTPSVLVIARSACAASVSLSVALPLAPEARSFAVAVLSSGLSARLAANETGTVNVRKLPAPALTCAPVAPKLVCGAMPVTTPQLAVPVAAQVTAPLKVTPAGSVSPTVTLSASDTPVLATPTR